MARPPRSPETAPKKVKLHKNARTTPAIRRELRESTLPVAELASRYGLSKATVRKWRRRDDSADRSHCPRRLRTTLSAQQEVIVVALRRTLLLPLDDLLAVTRELIHAEVSRSGLDRCLRRHGVSALKVLIPQAEGTKAPTKAARDYEPGFVHVDVKCLPQMPDEDSRRYLFVAVDRATRWVHVEILPTSSAHDAHGFLQHLLKAAPFKVTTVMTGNGEAFTDRFCASGERPPAGKHPFDRLCAHHQVAHRLIKPAHPQADEVLERFNGRISEVLTTRHFHSGEQLQDTLTRYANLYNHHIPQRALGHLSPVQALQQWHQKKPGLFNTAVDNLPGLDAQRPMMSNTTQITAPCLGKRLTSSPRPIVEAMERLKSRGGFGLTSLPGIHSVPRSVSTLEGDSAFDGEIMLPNPAGNGTSMRLMPPGGLEAAAMKPGKLLDLIQQPPEIDLRDAYDPGTSSLAELEEKRRELQYRKDWLEALLAVTQDEIAAFDEARKQRLLKDQLTKSSDESTPNSAAPDDRRESDSGNP